MKLKYLILLIFVNPCFALQIKEVTGNERITANISKNELNRIFVVDDRISEIFALEDDLFVEVENSTGQIFVKLNYKSKTSLTLFTENKQIIDLHLVAKDIPSESVMIKAKRRVANKQIDDNYVQDKASLILTMLKNKKSAQYSIKDKNNKVNLSEKFDAVEVRSYVGHELAGTTYKIINKTQKPIEITETQFSSDQDVLAVALNNNLVPPNGSTLAYVVRKNDVK